MRDMSAEAKHAHLLGITMHRRSTMAGILAGVSSLLIRQF